MEASTPIPGIPPPKRNRRKLLAILAAVAIAMAAFATWEIVRPRSIGEVLSMENIQAGSEISIQGTITAVGREMTSYGPRVYLQLDDNAFCGTEGWTGNLLGDPNTSYQIGDSYRTKLRFEAFEIDGDPAVWAPNLACPFLALYRSIAVVFDAVSQVRDLVLVYNRTDASGWSRYDIRSQNATGYDPARLPVDLLRALPYHAGGGLVNSASEWRDAAGRFYLMASGALSMDSPGFSIADRMTSLAAPTSSNGTLRFVDADLNGLVNSGDGLDVRLPSTGSSNRWDIYMVRIGNWSGLAPPYGAGVHVILEGPAGLLEALSGSARISALDLGRVGNWRDGERGRWVASRLSRESATTSVAQHERLGFPRAEAMQGFPNRKESAGEHPLKCLFLTARRPD